MRKSVSLLATSLFFGVTGLLAHLWGAPDTVLIIGVLNCSVFGSAAIILREIGR